MMIIDILNSVWPILVAIIVFGVMITVHELGHFLAAKSAKIKVNNFAIGFGPRILKWGKGETEYSLRAIPFGGYCAMEGEDTGSDSDKAYFKKPLWRRMIVVLAGSIFNFLLGFLLITLILSTSPDYNRFATTTITGFTNNAVSNAEGGLMAGDQFKRINGVKIYSYDDVGYELMMSSNGVFTMDVLRDGQLVHLSNVTFNMKEENGQRLIDPDYYVKGIDRNFGTVISQSFVKTGAMGRMIYRTLFDMFAGRHALSELSGPVGTTEFIGNAAREGFVDWGSFCNFLYMVAFITINLGLVNLLPFPGLDGGRFVFQLVELVRRKPVPVKYEGYVHAAGVALLMLLIGIVTISDIVRIAGG